MTQPASSNPEVRQAYELAAPARAGNPLTLLNALRIKRLLVTALSRDDAFQAYCQALHLGPQVRLEPRRIGSLLDAAKVEAKEFHILHQGGERVVCEPPEIIGPGRAPRIEGVTRTVFIACFENAVAHSRSGAIQLGSELCFDIQGEELGSVPVDMAFDPLIFSADGREVAAIIDRRPMTVLKLDRAWSLMGINSVSFGHWMFEGLLQFLSGHKALKLDGVPLLIDAQMPPQHRQSLELFGRGRFPIIEVPRWMRVEAGQLWLASNWAYSPHLLITDQGLDPKHFVGPMSAVASVYRWATDVLDKVLAVGRPEKQTFVARPATRHRRITNFDEVDRYLGEQGFSCFIPEQHPFGEQARTVRESRNIVVQNGSASHALCLARPKTKVCYLSHPAFPIVALLSEFLKSLDIEMKIVSGPFEKKTEPYLDQSDYRIPLGQLTPMVEGWLQSGSVC